MFSSISVLIPTRNRLVRLETMLRSFFETTPDLDIVQLVFKVDDDDTETQAYLLGHAESSRWKVVVGPRLQGYSSMPVFYNQMAEAAWGTLLMCGNDDMVFRTYNWAGLIIDKANEFPDGVFDIGISTYNEDHYPFAIVSRKVVEHLGFMWDPNIYWGDIYLRDVMGAFGRAVKLQSVQIDHDWAGHNPDSVFTEANQLHIFSRDPSYWAKTHADAVTEAVKKLRTLVQE